MNETITQKMSEQGAGRRQQYTDWWKTWWERDYSWEGLGSYNDDGWPKHPYEGWIVLEDGELALDPGSRDFSRYDPLTRPIERTPLPEGARLATLQDYWRERRIDLIADPTSDRDQDGNHTRHFTLLHLPLEWSDGSSTGKSDWDSRQRASLRHLISRKMTSSSETKFMNGFVLGPDRRAQFQGGIFLDLDLSDFFIHLSGKRPSLNWRSDFALFSNALYFGTSYSEPSLFSGIADFNNALFLETVLFEAVKFCHGAVFDNAVFSAAAYFTTTSFANTASFKRATFSTRADFENASWAGDADFENAFFAQDVYFNSVAISGVANFNQVVFAEGPDFSSSTFSIVKLEKAIFSESTNFENATFSMVANFADAVFCGEANFNKAIFSGESDFSKSIFADTACFRGEGEDFRVEALSLSGEARPDADTGGLTTKNRLIRTLDYAAIANRAFRSVNFGDAVFLNDADFDNRDFTEPANFGRARFYKFVRFRGSRMHQGVSFRNARFEFALHPDRQCHQTQKGIRGWLERRGGRNWPRVPKTVLSRLFEAYSKARATKGEDVKSYDAWCRDFEASREKQASELRLPKHKSHPKYDEVRKAQEDFFGELESCFRTLKLAMEERRDRVEEGKFFRLEIKTRRRRRKPNVPYWERIISDLYGISSGYGNSVVQPIYWIFANLVGFGLLYLALGSLSLSSGNPLNWRFFTPGWAEFWQAMNFSAGRVLGFGPWGDLPEPGTMMGNLLNVDDKGWGARTAFGVRLIASAQTILALILVFLSGLAVRRRLQIN